MLSYTVDPAPLQVTAVSGWVVVAVLFALLALG
jgi:hypothetical protein